METSEFIVKSQENQPKRVLPSMTKVRELQKKIKLEFMLCSSVCPSCLLYSLFIISFSSRN